MFINGQWEIQASTEKLGDSVKKEVEFPTMMQKLSDSLDTITSYTKFDWGLSNPTVKVALEDQSQFLLTPDYTPEEFVTEVDKAINDK